MCSGEDDYDEDEYVCIGYDDQENGGKCLYWASVKEGEGIPNSLEDDDWLIMENYHDLPFEDTAGENGDHSMPR